MRAIPLSAVAAVGLWFGAAETASADDANCTGAASAQRTYSSTTTTSTTVREHHRRYSIFSRPRYGRSSYSIYAMEYPATYSYARSQLIGGTYYSYGRQTAGSDIDPCSGQSRSSTLILP